MKLYGGPGPGRPGERACFDYSFDAMVAIALAVVAAAWMTDSEKAALRSRISAAALELASWTGSPGVARPEGMDARSR